MGVIDIETERTNTLPLDLDDHEQEEKAVHTEIYELATDTDAQDEMDCIPSLAEVFGEDTVVDVIADYYEDIPEKKWVVEGICTEGECVIISGASKSGKSYLMTNLAIIAASGGKWLDRFQCRKSSVLYLNGENSKDDARERFHVCFDSLGIDPDECSNDIKMICIDGFITPIQKLKETLIKEIEKNQYDLVILDPLYCFYSGSEIDEGAAKAFVSTIKEICRETGVVIFCVHHHSKSGGKKYSNASNRASGSGMLQRAFSTLLDVTEVDKKELMLSGSQRAFEFTGQPRQAENFKINLIFDFPVWEWDQEGVVPENAINKERTAKARQNNGNIRKGAELREKLPSVVEEAFCARVGYDENGEYVTIGSVLELLAEHGMNTSQRSVERALDGNAAPGYQRDSRSGSRSKIRRVEFMNPPELLTPEQLPKSG